MNNSNDSADKKKTEETSSDASVLTNNKTEEITSDASVLTNLDELIKNHVVSIDRIKADLKAQKEMFDDIFTNDSTYQQHNNKVKEAAKVRNLTKGQILKQPNVAAIAEKMKEMKSNQKELEMALSDYLREYARLSGANEIELPNGEVREIVYTARLVKKGK